MKYEIKDEILWKYVDGETVMVDPDKDSYSYLNAAGTQIWKMIDKAYSIDKIEEKFAQKYEVNGQNYKEDIFEIIEELVQSGFIKKVEDE